MSSSTNLEMGILETSIGQLGISLAIKISLVTTWLQSTQTLASGASFHNFLAIYTNTPGYPQHCWLLYHRRNVVKCSFYFNKHQRSPARRMQAGLFYFVQKLCHPSPDSNEISKNINKLDYYNFQMDMVAPKSN